MYKNSRTVQKTVYFLILISWLTEQSVSYATNRAVYSIGIFRRDVLLGTKLLEEKNQPSQALSQQLGQGLTDTDQFGRIVPSIAKSWRISKDRTEYEFHIRTDIKFHDGSNLKKQDVVGSIQRLVQDKSKFLNNYFRDAFGCNEDNNSCIAGISEFEHGVRINLPRPYAPLLKLLSSPGAAITPNIHSKFFIGSGPYKIVKRNQELFLESHKDYKGYHKPGNIDFKIIFKGDDFKPSVFFTPSSREVEAITDTHVTGKSFNLNAYHWFLNTKKKYWKQVNNRKVALKILESLIPDNFAESDLRLYDFFPKGMIGHTFSMGNYKRFRDSLNSVKVPSDFKKKISFASWGRHPFQSDLKRKINEKYGIVAKFINLGENDFLDKLSNSKADFLFLGWESPFNEPQAALEGFRRLGLMNDSIAKISVEALNQDSTIERANIYSGITEHMLQKYLFLPFLQFKSGFYWSNKLTYPKSEYQYSIRLGYFKEN